MEHDDMSDPMNCREAPPPNKPISVVLARALAEAADGFAGFPHPAFLVCPYMPEEKTFGGGFRVSGPYCGWNDVPKGLQDEVCNGDAGFFGPYDISSVPRADGDRVENVDLHIKESGLSFRVSTGQMDALFFSAQSVEKFAAPYYERIFGPDFVKKMMDQFQRANVQVMGHFPWTEYADGTRVLNMPMVLEEEAEGRAAFHPVHEGVSPIPVLRTQG
jgi:hypothetical protein